MPAAASAPMADGSPVTTATTAATSKRSAVTVTPYSDVVAGVSERNTEELERILRSASRVGDAVKLSILLEKLAEVPFNINARDPKTGDTALILASKSGHAKVVQLLTKFAADVTVANDDGQTAVELAANSAVRLSLLESVSKGAPQRNLCQAAWQGDAMYLRQILSQWSVDVNCHNTDGLTPLMLATRDVEFFEPLSNIIKYAYRPIGVVCELLAQSGDVRAIDGEKKTALHHICTSRSKLAAKVVECLLEAGADHSGRDRSWRTPLHYASAAGNVDVVSQLLDAGADPLVRDSSGQTPLHYSTQGSHEQTTSVLLRRGADVTLVDELGKTAYHYARTKRIQAMFRQCLPQSDPPADSSDVSSPLKAQSFGKIHVASVNDNRQHTSTCGERNAVAGSRVTSANALPSAEETRRDFGLERSRSQDEEEKDVDRTQHGSRACLSGAQTPPASCPTNVDNEGSPRQLSTSGAIYSRHMLSSSSQSISSEQSSHVSRSASLGARLSSTSQTRLNQKGMASMPTRRSPVNQRRFPAKLIVPSVSPTTAQTVPIEGGDETKVNVVSATTSCEQLATAESNDNNGYNIKQHHHVASANQSGLAMKQNLNVKLHELMNFGDQVKCSELQIVRDATASQPGLPVNHVVSCSDIASPTLSNFSCSILRSGAFNIEDTRVRNSDDSGVVADVCGSSASGNDSTSSSCSSSLSINHGSTAPSTTPQSAVLNTPSTIASALPETKNRVVDVRKLRPTETNGNSTRQKTSKVILENQSASINVTAKESGAESVNRFRQTTAAVITVLRPKLVPDVQTNLQSGVSPRDAIPVSSASKTKPVMNRSSSYSSKISESATPAKSDKSADTNLKPTQPIRKIDSSPQISSSLDSTKSSTSRKETIPSVAPSTVVTDASKAGTRSNVVFVESAATPKTVAAVAFPASVHVSSPTIRQIEVIDARTTKQLQQPVGSTNPAWSAVGKSVVRTTTNVEPDAKKVSATSRSKTVVDCNDDSIESGNGGTSSTNTSAVVALSGSSDSGAKSSSTSEGVSTVVSARCGKISDAASKAVRRTLQRTSRCVLEDGSSVVTEAQPVSNHSSPRDEGPMKPVKSDNLQQDQRSAGVHQQPKGFRVVGRGAVMNQNVAAGGFTVTGLSGMTTNSSPRGCSDDGHCGPVICDAFESLRQRQQKETDAAASGPRRDAARSGQPFSVPVTPCFGKAPPSSVGHPPTRPKTGGGRAVVHGQNDAASAVKTRQPRSRPTTARTQCGTRRRRKKSTTATPTPRTSSPASVANSSVVVRVKQNKQQPSGCVGTKRTDGRRARKKDKRPSAKRKAIAHGDGVGIDSDDVMALDADVATRGVTLIGGIGWHIATPCDDMADVRAVSKYTEGERSTETTPRRPTLRGTSKEKTTKRKTNDGSPLARLIAPTSGDEDDSDDDVFELSGLPDDANLPPIRPVRRRQVESLLAQISVKSSRQSTSAIQNVTTISSRSKQRVKSIVEVSTAAKSVRSELKSAIVDVGNCVTLDVNERSVSAETALPPPSSVTVDADVGRAEKLSRSSTSGMLDEVATTVPSSLDVTLGDNVYGSASYERRRKSRMEIVDAEIDATIDEMMKTSSSSLSSSTSRGHLWNSSPQRQPKLLKPHEDSPADGVVTANEKNVMTDNLVKDVAAAQLSEQDPDDGAARLVRAYRTMPLRATGGKPPVSSRRSNVIAAAYPTEKPKPETDLSEVLDAAAAIVAPTSRLQRSPRFVRKHDSVPSTPGEHGHRRHRHEDRLAPYHVDSLASSVELLDTVMNLDEIIRDDSLSSIVTSRLGRNGRSYSRAESIVSEALSATSDEIETIQWKRGNVLGKGAYGTVWCGLTNTGELIAVKMIELNTADMDKAEREYEQIQEEVGILKTLKHRNIVGYLGTCLEDMVVSIFMQFVPGGSIASVLARFGALEEEVFCNYTRQILEGVEYLHKNDVIHRDIKGGNIMLMPDGVIKLIDFGCAKKLCFNLTSGKPSDLLRSMRGTPYWMAPEVVKEEGHGTKSDIWSIGCTVFEMALKKPPWSDMAPSAAIYSIGSASQPIPTLPTDKFSVLARNFVTACLTRDPNERPSATNLLTHSFVTPRRRTAVRTSRRS